MSKLETRDGLPPALRVLVETFPRDGWEAHPNFSGLTRFWLDRHLMFRKVLGELQGRSQGLLDASLDPQRAAAEISRYAGFFLNELHGHHMIEDQHYFPALQALDLRVAAGFDLLDADHHALDGHLHGLAETTNVYLRAWNEPAARDRAGDLDTALRDFAGFLDRHLLDEEDLVVPVILAHAPDLH